MGAGIEWAYVRSCLNASLRAVSRCHIRPMNRFSGSCHCGRISVTLETQRAIADLVPRADQCGFCLRHRASAISDPEGLLVLTLPPDAPAPYRFGLGITDFHVCDRCGVFVAATWWDGAQAYGVVNVPALDGRDRFGAAVAADFEGETVVEREARRRRFWTPARVECGG